ncbi:MAG: hypothetical protein Q8K93_02580 [Reyranella sp.]|uniref:hypothetical protein n=1 Tax=Reyranella sp. TaxID=1929291 RepID=UPI002730D1BA|nr:hypothetical protein [Reyranella sp.]MDP1961068.1 hypothetical protein [Reyranella sp.]MDP2372334.1 hypothetical protein [Reyranella sp.]
MPLFFLIAIGAGAISLGAATADVVEDGHIGQTNHYAYSAPTQPQAQVAQAPSFDASAYASATDCLNAAALQGVSATACQR